MHDGWVYAVILEGVPVLQFQSSQRATKPGDVFIFHPDCAYGWQDLPKNPCKLMTWLWRTPPTHSNLVPAAEGFRHVLTTVVTKFNPIVGDAGAPWPKTTPPLGPELVSARFAGTVTPKISGEYKFVSNADDYVALWVNGVEEIAWSGHTAKDRFSIHSFQLAKDHPLDIRAFLLE